MNLKEFGEFAYKMLGIKSGAAATAIQEGFVDPKGVIKFFDRLQRISMNSLSNVDPKDYPDDIDEACELDFDLRRDLMKSLTKLMIKHDTCGYCGHTAPLVDDGENWPYCESCKGV